MRQENKNILRFFKKTLLFIIITTIGYSLFIFVWGSFFSQNYYNKNLPLQISFTKKLIQDAEETKNVDVLFLGSSHSYRGFDPRIFEKEGLSSFNLGTSSQTPIETKLLVEHFIDVLKPKTVIYEMFPQTFCTDGVESATDIIFNFPNFPSSQLVLDTKNIKVLNNHIFSLFNQVIKAPEIFIENNNGKYIKGGFVERKDSLNEVFDIKPSYLEFNEKQFKRFEEILKVLDKKNIKVILVQAPITSSLYNSYLNAETFDDRVITYERPYFNFNDLIEFDDRLHFFDSHHLNQNGVNFFNAELIKILKNEKLIFN